MIVPDVYVVKWEDEYWTWNEEEKERFLEVLYGEFGITATANEHGITIPYNEEIISFVEGYQLARNYYY